MVEEKELITGVKPPTLGFFIRGFLVTHEDSYPSEVHKAYKEAHRSWAKLTKRRFHVCT